jgi:hypothetical protein
MTSGTDSPMAMTWKVWTSEPRPVFEGTRAQATGYVVANLADSRDAFLESPDGDSFGYLSHAWVSLDTGQPWDPDSTLRLSAHPGAGRADE